jgi:hypothetical protein
MAQSTFQVQVQDEVLIMKEHAIYHATDFRPWPTILGYSKLWMVPTSAGSLEFHFHSVNPYKTKWLAMHTVQEGPEFSIVVHICLGNQARTGLVYWYS